MIVCSLDFIFTLGCMPTGIARQVSTPSFDINKSKAWLGIAIYIIEKVSPNLSKFTRKVSLPGAQLFRRRSLYPAELRRRV